MHVGEKTLPLRGPFAPDYRLFLQVRVDRYRRARLPGSQRFAGGDLHRPKCGENRLSKTAA